MANCKDCGKPLDFDKMLCRYCGGWTAVDPHSVGTGDKISKANTTTLDQVEALEIERIVTNTCFDAAWGGGFVPTSVTVAGGEPGAGKTSSLLQIASAMAEVTGKRAYFFSAEMAPAEMKAMAQRLNIPNLDRFRVMMTMGGGVEIDATLLKEDPPACFILDSISALCGRDIAAQWVVCKLFKKLSMGHKAPSLLVCHINKQSDYAGGMSALHEVDTLIAFDTDVGKMTLSDLKEKGYTRAELTPYERDMRIVVAIKNRFGPTHNETCMLMTPHGLVGLPPPLSEQKKNALKRPHGEFASPKATVIPPASSEANVIGDSLHPQAPEVIVVNGQKLKRVKPKKKKKGLFGADAAVAAGLPPVAADALRKPRAAMSRTHGGKLAAKERRKETRA